MMSCSFAHDTCLAATWCSFIVPLYLQRLERHTQNMDQAQYTEFCESRQLSFGEIVIAWFR